MPSSCFSESYSVKPIAVDGTTCIPQAPDLTDCLCRPGPLPLAAIPETQVPVQIRLLALSRSAARRLYNRNALK